MATQIRGVTPGRYRLAVSTILSHLQNHRNFTAGRVIKTWSLWNGGNEQTTPPTEDSSPWCQIRLFAGPVKRVAGRGRYGGTVASTILSNPYLLVELAVPTSDQLLFADVSERFREALWPDSDTDQAEALAMRCRFKEVGIMDWQLTQEILPTGPEDYGSGMITGRGRIDLSLVFTS